MSARPTTILCLASYVKGQEFLRECKRHGCRVLLLTVEKHRDAEWPRESIDERFLMPDLLRREHVINAVSYLARSESIDRIVPLDEFDLEMASTLREHLRLPGMGETTVRYFRDKLAMRMRARERGVPVPEFVPILNYDRIREYLATVPPPWVLKPRLSASAIGIRKLASADELWPILDDLGDRQSFHLLERFIPGNVYHVDSVVSEGEVSFAEAHGYVNPPFEVYHGGGLFATSTLETGSREERGLTDLNAAVAQALGMVRGVLHTEFIQSAADERFYFLETAARVGGAFIVEMVEAATGVNLWRECAAGGRERAWGAIRPAIAAARLRGPGHLACAPGVAGHVGVFGSGDRLAAPEAAPCRPDRGLAGTSARARADSGVHAAVPRGLLRDAPCRDRSDRLTAITSR